jgi:large subunit ribosomal protein L17
MRHGDRVKKLGRKKEHRRMLFRNLCRALFIHERIRTTLGKAKEARRLAERIIEFAKRNDLAARRMIYRFIADHKLVKIICDEIGPRFGQRTGGYTRIYRLGPRFGDGAEMAILELVELSPPETVDIRRKLIVRRSPVEAATKKEKVKKEKVKKEKPPRPEPKAKPQKKEKPAPRQAKKNVEKPKKKTGKRKK